LVPFALIAFVASGYPETRAYQDPARPVQAQVQSKPQPNAEQAEQLKIQQQIRDLEKRWQELRVKGMAPRYARDMENKKKDDELVAKLSQEAGLGYAKVSYPSSADNLAIPAYVFTPLKSRGPKGHPALIWIHGGVHSNFNSDSMPFIHQAVDRGYIVIAPDYRGSTGYGEAFHEAIDYGGWEIDDTMSAYDYLQTAVPAADPDRVGLIGWSHGGFITLHSLIRDQGESLQMRIRRRARHESRFSAFLQRAILRGRLLQPEKDRRPRLSASGRLYRTIARLSRRQNQIPGYGPCRHERSRRQFRRVRDDDPRPGVSDPAIGRDENLRRPPRRT
jgi:alpha/beta superfamily hydrolase